MDVRNITSKANNNTNSKPRNPLGNNAININNTAYIVMNIKALNDKIVLLYDRQYLNEVRTQYPNLTVYFRDEIVELKDKLHDIDHIKQVHIIKSVMGGWIVPRNKL